MKPGTTFILVALTIGVCSAVLAAYYDPSLTDDWLALIDYWQQPLSVLGGLLVIALVISSGFSRLRRSHQEAVKQRHQSRQAEAVAHAVSLRAHIDHLASSLKNDSEAISKIHQVTSGEVGTRRLILFRISLPDLFLEPFGERSGLPVETVKTFANFVAQVESINRYIKQVNGELSAPSAPGLQLADPMPNVARMFLTASFQANALYDHFTDFIGDGEPPKSVAAHRAVEDQAADAPASE